LTLRPGLLSDLILRVVRDPKFPRQQREAPINFLADSIAAYGVVTSFAFRFSPHTIGWCTADREPILKLRFLLSVRGHPMKTLLQLTALWCIAISLNAQTTTKWFSTNTPTKASNAPFVEDDPSGGHPTANLIYVPTSVSFSGIYFNVATADTTSGHYYDLGIGKCPSLDCSQPNVTITIVCNLGTSGTSGSGVSLASTGAQVFPCAQGSVTISPGTYILLGAGITNSAHCLGLFGGNAVIPQATGVGGHSTNGSLTNPNSTIFKTGSPAGAKAPGNACMISLH
jgi:hypothetical protein